MPAGAGESLTTTLFADVHYYFTDPSSRPSHHRFDKGSYVYLYFNAVQRQAKLEIANHAGTPNQDAFHGYLNYANIRYDHLHPTLFTINVNTGAVPDQTTWHLPSFNERNEQKYMYKLHTLDAYFWTEKDAASFLGHLKSILSSDKLDIQNVPAGSSAAHPEHRDSMSPVVQQLEKTAIGTPYQQRASSVISAQSLPGPPTPASGGSPRVATMGYNPAAPAAPEPVTYREKTPPPPDDGSGTGLGNAARYESAPPSQYGQNPGMYTNSNQTTPQNAYFSGPPQQPHSMPGPSSSVPPPQQRQPSFGPMAASTLPQSPPPHQQSFQRQYSGGTPGATQYANYNPQSQYANQPGTPGYNPNLPPTPSAPPAYSVGALQSPGLPPPPQQHQPPIGGYSNYSYSASQAPQAGSHNTYGGYTGDIHSQAYQPTEAEASSHHGKPKKSHTAPAQQDGKQPKITESFGNLETKVGKYLNKLDRLW